MHLELGHLPAAIYSEVLVPPAVVAELVIPVPGLKPFHTASVAGLRVVAPSNGALVAELRMSLDPGEAEAIALAMEVHASAILIDERAGRQAALRKGLTPIGVLGLLARAKHDRLVAAVAPLITRLEKELSFRVSASLREAVLRAAGEAKP